METEQRVVLAGRIDWRTAAAVRDHLARAIDAGVGDLTVDLTEADIGDSAGLGVLLGAYERARRLDRHLVVDGMSPRVERLMRVSRLERILVRGCEARRARTVAVVTA
jgi:anti-anti-sigma factor